MAFVSDASGISRIWVQTLTEGAAPIPITSAEAPALHPSWSPTNDEIVFHRPGDGIWTVGPLGTPAPRRLIEEGINPSFSWDGAKIVYERFPQVWLANADGPGQHAVAGGDLLIPTAAQNVVGGYPALSPDGDSIVYFRMASGPMGDFWVVPSAGGEPRRLTFDTNQASHPVWTPNGQHVVFSSMRSGSRTLWRISEAGGEPEPVTSGAGEDGAPSISRDGRRLVYSNARNEKAVMIYDPQAAESREILVRRYGLVHPRFSPDGGSVVYFGEVAGGTELFVGADGQGMRQVTRGDGQFNIHPRWSADGTAIYFYRDYPYRDGSPGELLSVSPAGGPGDVVLPDFYWDRNIFAEVHPEDNAVAYLRINRPPEPSATIVRDIDTGQERILPTPPGWDADVPFFLESTRWSHDGQWLVGSDAGRRWREPHAWGRNRLWVCTRELSCELTVVGFGPVWSADDSQIYFSRLGSTPATREVWVADPDGGNARRVTEIGPIGFISPAFDVAPDGRIVWIQDRLGRPEIWSAEIE
jgi:Tol biopolymer transport system component